jgi:hypothetical protein
MMPISADDLARAIAEQVEEEERAEKLKQAVQSPESWWVDTACLVSAAETDEYDVLEEGEKALLNAIMRL